MANVTKLNKCLCSAPHSSASNFTYSASKSRISYLSHYPLFFCLIAYAVLAKSIYSGNATVAVAEPAQQPVLVTASITRNIIKNFQATPAPHTVALAFNKAYTTIVSCASAVSAQQPKDNNKQYISHYLAGLIEGDGYITITNENRVILGITFNLKDKPLAEKLLNYLGKGTIVKRQSNSIELRFSSKKTLYKIIHLINGKFRSPKIEQLYNLID